MALFNFLVFVLELFYFILLLTVLPEIFSVSHSFIFIEIIASLFIFLIHNDMQLYFLCGNIFEIVCSLCFYLWFIYCFLTYLTYLYVYLTTYFSIFQSIQFLFHHSSSYEFISPLILRRFIWRVARDILLANINSRHDTGLALCVRVYWTFLLWRKTDVTAGYYKTTQYTGSGKGNACLSEVNGIIIWL